MWPAEWSRDCSLWSMPFSPAPQSNTLVQSAHLSCVNWLVLGTVPHRLCVWYRSASPSFQVPPVTLAKIVRGALIPLSPSFSVANRNPVDPASKCTRAFHRQVPICLSKLISCHFPAPLPPSSWSLFCLNKCVLPYITPLHMWSPLLVLPLSLPDKLLYILQDPG